MRTARLVGPTVDGTSMVLVTEDGEELTVPLDDRARTLLGSASDDPPPPSTARTNPATTPVRPRRREISMDTTATPLTPRDIQTRIRAGESLEDVVTGSGMDAARVERFAAPVLAEREHMALTALGSSVRRRGEGSGARPLRAVVAERLLAQGVDADEVSWDAWKDDDTHWQVVADYELGGEARHAEFRFDPQSRFSLAVDDDARWLAGERPSPLSAAVDRDDELALIRATQDPDEQEQAEREATAADALGTVLQIVPPVELSADELDELVAHDPESDGPESDDAGLLTGLETDELSIGLPDDLTDVGSDEDDLTSVEPTLVTPRDEAAEPTIAVVRHLTRVTVETAAVDVEGQDDPAETRSALDTLYDMLGGDGYAEDSTRVYAGLTDAAAVPVVDEHEFEPPADVLVPAEPDNDVPGEDEAEAAGRRPTSEDDPAGAQPEPTPASEPDDDSPEPLVPAPGASRKPGRRKRASVPSWDEIMFGGPKRG